MHWDRSSLLSLEMLLNLSSEDRGVILEGERVLLYLDPRRTWLIQVKRDSPSFHTHAGILEIPSILGKRFGESVTTSLGETIRILRPTTLDYIMKSERRTQIVYPKDFSYISARSGIRSGSNVLECGTGSGALTSYFASIVSPRGLVHTFEERGDFFSIAKKNVQKAGFSDIVKFENRSLLEADDIQESYYDLALLDMGSPWSLLIVAHRALKGSGFVFCICPTTNQLETVAISMKTLFCDIESVEIMLRHIEAREGKTRPSMRMIGHTCYLISGRKIFQNTSVIESVKSATPQEEISQVEF